MTRVTKHMRRHKQKYRKNSVRHMLNGFGVVDVSIFYPLCGGHRKLHKGAYAREWQ